jgi:hypothetical protein
MIFQFGSGRWLVREILQDSQAYLVDFCRLNIRQENDRQAAVRDDQVLGHSGSHMKENLMAAKLLRHPSRREVSNGTRPELIGRPHFLEQVRSPDRLQNKLTDNYLFALPISVSIHSYSR